MSQLRTKKIEEVIRNGVELKRVQDRQDSISNSLKIKIENLKKEAVSLEESVLSNQEKISTQEETLKTINEMRDGVEENIKEKNAYFKTKISEMSEVVSLKRKELDVFECSMDAMVQKKEKIHKNIEDKEDGLSMISIELVTRQRELSNSEEKIAEHKERFDSLMQDIHLVKQKVSDGKKELNTIRESKESITEEVGELKKKVSLEKKIFSDIKKEKEICLGELSSKIKTSEDSLKKLQEEENELSKENKLKIKSINMQKQIINDKILEIREYEPDFLTGQ